MQWGLFFEGICYKGLPTATTAHCLRQPRCPVLHTAPIPLDLAQRKYTQEHMSRR